MLKDLVLIFLLFINKHFHLLKDIGYAKKKKLTISAGYQ